MWPGTVHQLICILHVGGLHSDSFSPFLIEKYFIFYCVQTIHFWLPNKHLYSFFYLVTKINLDVNLYQVLNNISNIKY